MTEDPRRERMLQLFETGEVPVPISTIVVGGPILDLRMTLNVHACVYAEVPTYEVFVTDDELNVDAGALRLEIAACRLPDRVNVNYDEALARRNFRRAVMVSKTLDIPVGVYAKGFYHNRKKTPLTVLVFMGFLPAPVFLNRLKHVATG